MKPDSKMQPDNERASHFQVGTWFGWWVPGSVDRYIGRWVLRLLGTLIGKYLLQLGVHIR